MRARSVTAVISTVHATNNGVDTSTFKEVSMMRLRAGMSIALAVSALGIVMVGGQSPAFADNLVNEKVLLKQRGLTNDGVHVVVDESGSVSASGHASLNTPSLQAEVGLDETGALSVSGYATTPDLELVGLTCTIESLESGHCESS